VDAVVELAGDEHVGPVAPGGADRLTDLPLVAVHLGRVDVPVADLQRPTHDPDGVLGVDLKDTEAELRDRVTVVEVDRRNGAHAVLCSFVGLVVCGIAPQGAERHGRAE